MRHYYSFVLLLVSLVFLNSTQSLADQPFFDLVCKSGENMRVEMKLINAGGLSVSVTSQFIVNFKKATTAAANMNDGECAWRDRPLNSNEAACFFTNLDDFATSISLPKKIGFKNGGTVLTGSGTVFTHLTEMDRVKKLRGPVGERVVVRARNVEPGRCLEVNLF
ncbi:MAG: hypothetical protein SGI74_06290 [Oligoflexia bacterium]|nr:hypothetical protein [Oligoflexia bacterium]